jgi:hypothetical protein
MLSQLWRARYGANCPFIASMIDTKDFRKILKEVELSTPSRYKAIRHRFHA